MISLNKHIMKTIKNLIIINNGSMNKWDQYNQNMIAEELGLILTHQKL